LKIFNSPTGIPSELLAKWKEAKPFELENYINNKSISLNENLKIASFKSEKSL
jgi:hypothetical protein